MAGERLRALADKVGDAIERAEDLLTRLEDAREDISEAVDARVADLRSALAGLHERFTELEAGIEEEEGDILEGDVIEVP